MNQTKRSLPKFLPLLLGAVAILLLAAFFLVFFLPRANATFSYECFTAERTVEKFLDALIDCDYAKAVRYVGFTDENGEKLSDDDLSSVWMDRVRDQQEGAAETFLISYEDPIVEKIDGEMTVTVFLTVRRAGGSDGFYANGNSFTLIRDGGWRITSVSSEEYGLQTSYEKALSGVIVR